MVMNNNWKYLIVSKVVISVLLLGYMTQDVSSEENTSSFYTNTSTSSTITGTVGGNVTLDCLPPNSVNISGLFWINIRQNETIKNNSPWKHLEKSALTLFNLSESQAGIYLCQTTDAIICNKTLIIMEPTSGLFVATVVSTTTTMMTTTTPKSTSQLTNMHSVTSTPFQLLPPTDESTQEETRSLSSSTSSTNLFDPPRQPLSSKPNTNIPSTSSIMAKHEVIAENFSIISSSLFSSSSAELVSITATKISTTTTTTTVTTTTATNDNNNSTDDEGDSAEGGSLEYSGDGSAGLAIGIILAIMIAGACTTAILYRRRKNGKKSTYITFGNPSYSREHLPVNDFGLDSPLTLSSNGYTVLA